MTTTPPNLAKLMENFIRMEEAEGFFTLPLRGHAFWAYVRTPVYEAICSMRETNTYDARFAVQGSRRSRKGVFAYLKESIKAAVYLMKFLLSPGTRYDAVVVNYDRRNIIDGKNVNMNCYPLITRLHTRLKTLTIDPTELHEPVEKQYPCDILRYRPFYLLDKLLCRGMRYTDAEQRLLKTVEEKIKEYFDVSIDILSLVSSIYPLELRTHERLLRLLTRYRPKILICAHHDKALFEAAHELGIKTVEMQHSIISSLNSSYNYGSRSVALVKPFVADYIFTFGRYWNDEISSPSAVIATGYPYFDIKREAAKANAVETAQAMRNDPAKSIIIISNLLEKKLLTELTLELCRLLPEYTIYYKLKLNDYQNWQARYPEAFTTTANLVVIASNQPSLYDYFSRCSYQIGINSGGIYEGMAFNLITFILKTGWYAENKRLYEGEHVFLVSTVDEIAKLVKSGEIPKRKFNCEAIYRPNSLKTMEEELMHIIHDEALPNTSTH